MSRAAGAWRGASALCLALAVCALSAFAAGPGIAQIPDATVTLRHPEDARHLAPMVDELGRRGRTVTMRVGDPDLASGAPPMSDRPEILIADFTNGLSRALLGTSRLPVLVGDLAIAWEQRPDGRSSLRSVGLILGSLVAGCVMAFMTHRVLGAIVARRPYRAQPDFVARLKASGLELACGAVGLAVLAAVGLSMLNMLLPGEGFDRRIGRVALLAMLAWGLYLLVGRFLLAPGRPDRRLMPLPRAEIHMRWLAIYGLMGPLFTQSVFLVRGIPHDEDALTGWIFVGVTVLTLVKIGWFWSGRRDIAALVAGRALGGAKPGLGRQAAGLALPWLFIIVALLIWAAASTAAGALGGTPLVTPAGATQNLTIMLPIVAAGTSALVASISRRVLAGRTDPARLALAAVARTVATGAVWVASLALLAKLWGDHLMDPSSAELISGLRLLTRAGAAIVTGWAIWSFCTTYFDAHLPPRRGSPDILSGDDDDHVHVATRLGTVMPVVRNLVLGAILAVTGLVVLSALGMEIGPFLAGFGVIGLAVSFGSQALVRDIVSGIFFMTDDAFRVGEYIDTGRLKGTVERISIRSVQLRHQNGQVHTIPFGQLQSTTNFSRDWSTVKFQLRLDRDSDPELARRTIKKVGLAMMDDPAFAAELLQPLKMQGIQEITDTAIVVRCKFTCRPFKPTWIQREALKRIYIGLTDAGIRFATNAVSIRDGQGQPSQAAAAATLAGPVANAAG